jgi:hypothetical protein
VLSRRHPPGCRRRYLRKIRPQRHRAVSEILAPPSFPLIRHVFSLSGRKKTEGRRSGHLPFRYYGIYDETVDYQEIPWRNGRFDPNALSASLATRGRARHALKHWREKAQRRTLAFCVSTAHADFMADQFNNKGVRSAAVYRGSSLDRGAALDQLARGELDVLFSVDLFNEGVDLPAIDTVMMLRPTESKILFLQQLGRGLRRHPGKERLVVLDFIGNHRGFLNKPDALFDCGKRYGDLAAFARRAGAGTLELPPGCFANYDLAIIDFLKRLTGSDLTSDYEALKESLGRRPTLAEVYRSGARVAELRRRGTHWWELVRDQGDLEAAEAECLDRHSGFFREVETMTMVRSFKAILLESLLEVDGLRNPPRVEDLAAQALAVFRRRRQFIGDIAEAYRNIDTIEPGKWLRYWNGNPINAWIGGNRKDAAQIWFDLREDRFAPNFEVTDAEHHVFQWMVQELVDYRLAAYEARRSPSAEPAEPEAATTEPGAKILPFHRPAALPDDWAHIPYFPDLRIACGHFHAGRADAESFCAVSPGHGRLDPHRHFVARAIGNSMDGGKNPVRDGDYLLLELMDPASAGSITGATLVVERESSGDDQYVLRTVTKTPEGRYVLKPANPAYADYESSEEMRTLARLKAVLGPDEINIEAAG